MTNTYVSSTSSSSSSYEPSPTTSNYDLTGNTTGPANSTDPASGFDFGCIPAEVAFVVMASVGSLVVFLLASILVLACQVCRLQRRQHTGRHSRSNVDLVSGAGYWGTGNQAEGGGIVGPCDASVMLEEVKPQEEQEEFEDEYEIPSEVGSEVVVTEDSRRQPGITVAPVGELVDVGVTETSPPPPPPPPPPPMPGSKSTETCLEMGSDLEGIPLVV